MQQSSIAEDIRKFLIEHELGRRIAMMLRRELNKLKEKLKKDEQGKNLLKINEKDNVPIDEPVSRFFKSYAVFIEDHTEKEDKFFDLIDKNNKLSFEDIMLLKHYHLCKNRSGGEVRIKEMIRHRIFGRKRLDERKTWFINISFLSQII